MIRRSPGWVSFAGNTRQVLRHSASDNPLTDFFWRENKSQKEVEPLKGFECGEGFFFNKQEARRIAESLSYLFHFISDSTFQLLHLQSLTSPLKNGGWKTTFLL